MTRLFTLLLLVLPLTAWAETVTVRSGDHADFSRLVLEYEAGLDWRFGRVEGGYEFRPTREELSWDLNHVYDLISRARIAAVQDRGDGRLFLAVDCACHADAFVLRSGEVVLDIKDGAAARPNAPFETTLAPVPRPAPRPQVGALAFGPRRPVPARSSLGPAGHSDAGADTAVGLPDFLLLRRARSGPGLPGWPAPGETPPFESTPADAGAPPPDAAAPDSVPSSASADRVAATEAALLQQLARAAAQGLIDADLSRIEDDIRAATDPLGPPSPDAAPDLREPPPPVTPQGHMSIETGVDRAAPTGRFATGQTDDGATCIDPALFDIASWGGSIENGADIGSYRSHIIGEFDIADGAGVTDLARHYLYITFGAETKALLRQFPDAVVRADLLAAMAEIMDDGAAETATRFIDQMACDGATALWAVLAQPRLSSGQSINTQAVTLAFAALPEHLRRHLGPDLADKFLDIGDMATAERIRNAIARAETGPDAALDLLGARLDLADGRIAPAEAQLDAVVARESDVLPEALLDRVDAALAREGAVAPEQVSLLQSLAFEYRGTEQGAALLEAEIKAHAASGDFDAAFARLAEARVAPFLASDRVAALGDAVFAALTKAAADPTFLRHAAPRLGDVTLLPAPTRRAIAARLLDLGLVAPARRVLAGAGAIPGQADRILFARAALAERRPEIAIGYLAGLSGAPADRLRAEALEAAGDFARAAHQFDVTGDPVRGMQSAWRGGIWSDVAGRDAGAVADAAGLMIGQVPATAPDGPAQAATGAAARTPLARSQALIDASRATRAVLDALLEEIRPAPAPAGS